MKNTMAKCKSIYLLLEKNMTPLSECGKTRTQIARVQRYIEFRKHFNLPEAYYEVIQEGTIRSLLQLWQDKPESPEVLNAVENIKQQIEQHEKAMGNVSSSAKEIREAYEKLQGLGVSLTNAQLKAVEKSEVIEDKERKKITIQFKNDIRKIIDSAKHSGKIPIRKRKNQSLTLVFTPKEYKAIQNALNEGKKAKTKMSFGKKVVSFLMQAIARKLKET